MKTCPFCAEEIQDAAIKCKHCGEMLDTPPPTRQKPEAPKKKDHPPHAIACAWCRTATPLRFEPGAKGSVYTYSCSSCGHDGESRLATVRAKRSRMSRDDRVYMVRVFSPSGEDTVEWVQGCKWPGENPDEIELRSGDVCVFDFCGCLTSISNLTIGKTYMVRDLQKEQKDAEEARLQAERDRIATEREAFLKEKADAIARKEAEKRAQGCCLGCLFAILMMVLGVGH